MCRHRGHSQREQPDDRDGGDHRGHRHQRERAPVDRHCSPPEDAGPGIVSSAGLRALAWRTLGPMTSGVTTVGVLALVEGPVEVMTAGAPVVGRVAVSTGVVAAAVPLSVMVCLSLIHISE